MQTLQDLRDTLPQTGVVDWIGVRPARRETVSELDAVTIDTESGLEGDRYSKAGGKRQVTLIQGEHLDALASMLGAEPIEPATVRRNIVVRGINLLALKEKRFRIGSAVLEYTGLCHPCSHMEEALGPGGYNAMRGHGGITATVISGGEVRVGDSVSAI